MTKAPLLILLVVALLPAASHAGLDNASGVVPTEAVPAPPLFTQGGSLPSCWHYDGNACTSPGATVRCMWAPYEPGMCGCTSEYVWACG